MSDTEIDLQTQFPSMQPIQSPPRLFRLNGCGTGVFGARDRDPETGAYIKTYCISILFIPVLALRAYRVLDAERGWYFLGREPLSAFAKFWNRALVGGLLCWGGIAGWHAHTTSPGYLADVQLAKAKGLAATGRLAEAARLDCGVFEGISDRTDEARMALKTLLDGPVHQAPAQEVAAVFAALTEWQAIPVGRQTLPDLRERGMVEVERFAGSDPGGAVVVLDALAPLVQGDAVLAGRREQLLEQAVAKEPQNVDLASRLALIYEGREEMEKCTTLLTPHKERLGGSEGARILGQIYARQGDAEASFPLLAPYTEDRLKRLHTAEQAYEGAVEAAGKRAVDELNDGQGPPSFYRRYQAAGAETEKQAMVRDYVASCVRENPAIQAKQEALMREASVVPVALDLGIVRLRRAQAMAEEAARRRELEAAERTFLAIRGLAGESDAYRLFLGQVDYWLGKHEEGRKLLDELLASKQRGFETLMSVSRTLREVGAASEARELSEEAYNSETDQTKKHQAAAMRALILLDLDDEIKWLGRADPSDAYVKASLSAARGHKALSEGRNEEAARHLREAIAVYSTQVQNVFTVNNTALAYLSLFQATGEHEAYDKSIEMLDKAVALRPSDSILLFNSGTALLDGALTEIIGDRIDLRRLHERGSLELFSFLYKDAAGREPFQQRVRTHAGIAKALAYLDKVLVLSPKNANAYAVVASVRGYVRDTRGLHDLRDRMATIDITGADIRQRTLDFYAGKQDARYRKDTEASIERFSKLVDELRAKSRDATFAVAAGELLESQITGSLVGLTPDADAIVSLAREAYAAVPSAATHSMVITALLFRAGRSLSQQAPAYAAMESRAGHAMASVFLVAVALGEPGETSRVALENKDIREALSLIVEDMRFFPDSPTVWEWAMLRVARPAEAADMARAFQQSETSRLRADIDRLLAPVSANEAIKSYWTALLAGNEAEGRASLKAYAARGVPLPMELK